MIFMFLIFRLFGWLNAKNKKSPEVQAELTRRANKSKQEFWKRNPKLLSTMVVIDVIATWVIVVNMIANHASCHLTGTNC